MNEDGGAGELFAGAEVWGDSANRWSVPGSQHHLELEKLPARHIENILLLLLRP